jgi:DNA-binding XRE family transcriptional regulator
MRTSLKKTTAAVLRSIIGIKDIEMAKILDCHPATIHSIESGRLKLSDSLAMRMAHETGVAMNWLLDGNPKVSPVARNGTPFTHATFDRARSKRVTPFKAVTIAFAGHEYSKAISSILRAAHAKGNGELAVYKIGRAINDFAREFGDGPSEHLEFASEAFRRFFFAPRKEKPLPAKKQRRKPRSSRAKKRG